jgi:very-short-patch-repair endonuclease
VQLMGNDVHDLRGLRLSTPARVWCELAAELDLGDLVAAGDYIIHWRLPLCSFDELERAVTRFPGRDGRARLREALPLLDNRTESPRESLLRVMLVRAGITGMRANLTVRVRGRTFRIDLAIPRHKIALEYQGEHHNDPVQWRKDMTKREILATDGWHTMEINADDLRETELIDRIRVTIASRPVLE